MFLFHLAQPTKQPVLRQNTVASVLNSQRQNAAAATNNVATSNQRHASLSSNLVSMATQAQQAEPMFYSSELCFHGYNYLYCDLACKYATSFTPLIPSSARQQPSSARQTKVVRVVCRIPPSNGQASMSSARQVLG